MSFASLNCAAVDGLIERFGAAADLTVVVGAGASMESGLPSWRELVCRLLRRVAEDVLELGDRDAREGWIQQTLEQGDLGAAAAVVEALADDDLDTLLPQELYGDDGAANYEPGPMLQQIARLRRCFGDQMTILTTNYDDLIERALHQTGYRKRNVRSYVRRRRTPPASAVAVTHLHGLAARETPPKQLVLTEAHYHRMQRGSSWQEQYVTERLRESRCLFIGTALTDPNLIRYLYGYGGSDAKHAVIFVRQADLNDMDPEVRTAHERAVTARWGCQGVEAVFVDHFADAAQLLHEIGLRHEMEADYVPIRARIVPVIDRLERYAFCRFDGQRTFGDRQVALSAHLRDTLDKTMSAVTRHIDLPEDECLALALWVLGPRGKSITGWAHSDRAHQDPRTIEPLPVRTGSMWVAVRALCSGVQIGLDLGRSTSRWRFVRGLPLTLDRPTRLPIGCVTISSSKSSDASILTTLDDHAQTQLHRGLLKSICDVLEPVAHDADPAAHVCLVR